MVTSFAYKLWWHLLQGKSFLSEFMFKKYVGVQHPVVVSTERPSGTWWQLLKVSHLVKSQMRWCVGQGGVDFWYDRWCSNELLYSKLERQVAPGVLVSDFFDGDAWDVWKLQEVLLPSLVRSIS